MIEQILPVLPLVAVVGFAIGLTGIGGVLMVPLLVDIAGLEVADALPASLAAFAFTGVVGTVAQASQADGATGMARPFMISAGLGAVIGLWVASGLERFWPLLLLAVLAIVSALGGLLPRTPSGDRTSIGVGSAAGIGGFVGVVSALTGTGGPVTLAPLLMLGRVAPGTIAALAQSIQIPIGGLAAATAMALGMWSVFLALVLGPALALGAAFGVALRPRLPAVLLRQAMSVLLLGYGIWTLRRLLLP